jgi:general secretion pathway protein G
MSNLTHSLRRPRATSRRGFTLLEILVVLAILGMLVGVLVNHVKDSFDSGREQTAKIFVTSTIDTNLMRYRLHMGDFPSTAEGLDALATAPAGKGDKWRGPYIKDGKLPLDPWGEPYGYRYPGTKNKNGQYDVFSKGVDKTADTPDDIGNWAD